MTKKYHYERYYVLRTKEGSHLIVDSNADDSEAIVTLTHCPVEAVPVMTEEEAKLWMLHFNDGIKHPYCEVIDNYIEKDYFATMKLEIVDLGPDLDAIDDEEIIEKFLENPCDEFKEIILSKMKRNYED